MERHGARRLRLGAPPLDEARQREVEEVVPGEDDELVALEPRRLDREPEIAHRAEPVLVRRCPVVVHRRPRSPRPSVRTPGAKRLFVTRWTLVHVLDLAGRGRAPSRASAARRPAGDASAGRPSAAAAASRSPLRGSRTSRAATPRTAARWTPSSVTIAAMSAAGVTSKAGLRAGKRLVSSAGSRSSIGIPEPSGVARSSVEVGATT